MDDAQEAFVNSVLPYAQLGNRSTGIECSVILAQWACETGWGSSDFWTQGHNPAGISPGGAVAAYPSIGAGVDAWLETIELPDYDAVRRAVGRTAQALALGESPWAAGHYDNGGGPGSTLLALIADNSLWLYDVAAPAPQPQPQPHKKDGPVKLPLALTPNAEPVTFYSDPAVLDQIAVSFDSTNSPPPTGLLRALVHIADGTGVMYLPVVLTGNPALAQEHLAADADGLFVLTSEVPALVQVPIGYDMVSLRSQAPAAPPPVPESQGVDLYAEKL